MFTPETLINTVETAKLNTIEKTITHNGLKENMKAFVRAEANFAKTIAATTKNVFDEVANFKYAEAATPMFKNFENFFKTK